MKGASENNTVTYHPNAVFQTQYWNYNKAWAKLEKKFYFS
jgi:hypothetical protein